MPDVPSSARPDGDTSSSDGTTTYLDAMSFPDGPAPAPASVAAAAAAAATGETPRRGSRARVSWVGDAAATGPVAAAWSPVGTDGTGGDPEFSLEPDLAADGLDEAEDGGGTPSSAKVFGVKPPWGWDYVFSFPLEDSLLAPPGARAAAAGATAADAPPVGDAPARPSGDTVDDADASGGSSKASRKAAKAVAHRVRILARLRSAGFVFSQLAVPSEGRVLVRFGLDEAGLKRKAALLGLKLRLQNDFGGGYLDYEPERDAAFVNALRSGCYFAPSDRILIILSTLASKAVWGCDINVEAEVFSGHICQAFAIHDRGPRDQLVRDVVWDRLWDVRWTPPLSALRDYVGARVCMYFTFLSFYTQMLLYIGVVSLPIYIASKLTSSAVVVAALRFVFAIALVLWTTVFLERWKRRNAGVQLEWGLSDFADDTADDVRPQFLGEIRPGFYCKGGFVPLDDVAEQKAADLEAGTPSRTTTLRRRAVSTLSTSAAVDVVDGEPDGGGAGGGSPASAVTPTTDDDDGELVADDLPYQPWVRSNRFRKAVLVSVSATIFFTSLVATASFLLLLYKREVANGIGKFGNSTAAHYLPGVLQGIMITILDPIWRSISLWLTQMENHRTNQAYEDALVIKRFSFMFVSNYVSLFYIAFVRPWVGDGEESCAVSSVTGLPDCTVELEAQLLSMIITKTTVQQALEILLPWLMTFVQHQLGRWRAYRARRKSASAAAAGDVEEGAANPTSRFSRYVRESMLPPFSTTIEDYAEMVVQVGYLSLFGVAFPLVTFVALLNNLIEVRSDAFKILRLHQRVDSDQSGDIGAWLSILEFINILSVATNGAIIVFTSNSLEPLFGDLDLWRELLAFFVIEHTLFAVKGLFAFLFQDVPANTMRTLARQRYDVARFFDVGWTDPMRGHGLLNVSDEQVRRCQRYTRLFADLSDSESEEATPAAQPPQPVS